MNKVQQSLHSRTAQSGQTVIGALLALVIFGTLIFYATSRYTDAQRDSNADRAASDLLTLMHDADTTYSTLPSCGGGVTTNCGFWNVTVQALTNAGDIPPSMIGSTAGTLTSRFGTPVTVAPYTVFSQDDSMLIVFRVPVAQCARFATGVAAQVVVVNVGGTQVQNTVAGNALNPTMLGQKCAAGNGSVTIQLVHML